MPELPEVETIRRQLAGRIEGRVIEGVTVSDARLVDPWEAADFADHLNGRRIERIDRVGKYLLFELDSAEALTLHLRMTGQLLWSDSVPDPPLPYTRAVLAFAGGGAVTFADARRFGTASFLPREGRTAIWGGRTGVDAMSSSFTARALGRSLAGRSAPIKALILNQRIVAGVGNIYADEALFLARIHPRTPGGNLDVRSLASLHRAIRDRLRMGIQAGGTSFDRYRDVNGERGGMQDLLRVHRRQGEPCPRCLTTIEKGVVAQRGTYWCPTCQPPPGGD